MSTSRLFSSGSEYPLRGSVEEAIKKLIGMAIREDLGSRGDITTKALGKPAQRMGKGMVVAEEKKTVVCGLQVAEILLNANSKANKKESSRIPQIKCHCKDGDEVVAGKTILTATAPLRDLLTMERILLNFLQHLSGVATRTREWVTSLKKSLGENTCLLDTRKTLPGYRVLEKYAVWCGGGKNHRMGLYDSYLIKDNHIEILRSPVAALEKVLDHKRNAFDRSSPKKNKVLVEIECQNLDEVKEVVAFNRQARSARNGEVDIIMLDNFSLGQIDRALTLIDKCCQVEVSGNISLAKIKKLASFKGRGIDFVSAGALTHSVNAVELSMNIENV